MPTNTFVTCSDLSFAWPDGTSVLDGLTWAAGPGRTGLVGVNGSGKSTLLRLIAGELAHGGSVQVAGEVGYLPQNLTLDTGTQVDQALGIAERRAALRAIESGDVRTEHFTTVGDDWDVIERAYAALDQLGLGDVDLDRTTGELSGGESVLLRLAALLVRRPDVLLLDEPTNNLDRSARHRLYETVGGYTGVLIVVSHDRELLRRVDRIADLRDGDMHTYGGDFDAYERAVAAEQEAAERMVRMAESDVRRQRRKLAEAETKLARRKRYGDRMSAAKREPKIIMNQRKSDAQISAGKHRALHEDRLEAARERFSDAEEQVREDDEIRVDLPHTEVPGRRQVLNVREVELRYGARIPHLDVHGPERIALTGDNGAGKSTLLRTIADLVPPERGELTAHVPLRYLPQRLDVLDDDRSIVANVAALAPRASNNRMRAQLARMLFKGAQADQLVGTLSGGERFRATLAALMLAEPAPQLLLVDEPTNNLDLASVRQLRHALESYRGALIVASHDVPFLREIGITRWLRLDGDLVSTTADEL